MVKIPITTKFPLRHPRYDLSAMLRSLSEQPFYFTMHVYDWVYRLPTASNPDILLNLRLHQ